MQMYVSEAGLPLGETGSRTKFLYGSTFMEAKSLQAKIKKNQMVYKHSDMLGDLRCQVTVTDLSHL